MKGSETVAKQYVLVDLEWIDNSVGHSSPTQLAAMRVDENWNPIQTISTLIRPQNSTFHDWKHVAYSGGKAEDFLMGRSAYHALEYFEKWLQPEDVICWWFETGRKTYEMLARRILKVTERHPSVIMVDYLRGYLQGGKKYRLNPYQLAKEFGIDVPKPEHSSQNDVTTMQLVLKKIEYPQSLLELPPKKEEEPEKIFSYYYDPESKLLHKRESSCLVEGKTYHKFGTLSACIKKKLRPCPLCIKEEYEQERRARTKDILNRTEYTYIFLPKSKVFHRYDCSMIKTATQILGCRDYEKAARTGRTPCKICHPTPKDTPRKTKNNPVLSALKQEKKPKLSMSRDTKHALTRLKQAQRDLRDDMIYKQNPGMAETDVRTLTHTGYAFWAAKGYQTFHLRNCPRLTGLSDLKGFARYDQAKRAGYTPCKRCNPTPKYNVAVSMPITTRVRKDEKQDDLVELCKENGYAYQRETSFFYIETPVGKWKINLSTKPILLDHINLAEKWKDQVNYHRQPRAFLSLIDTFLYIRRHDNTIIDRLNQKKSEMLEGKVMGSDRVDKEIERITEALKAVTGKVLTDEEMLDLKISVFVDQYKDSTMDELEDMLAEAEDRQSELEDMIDELESKLPEDEESPEYLEMSAELDNLREELDDIEDQIDNLEDEIAEREDSEEEDE